MGRRIIGAGTAGEFRVYLKLADVLGHSSINTPRIYIATTGTEHLRQMERMRLVI